MSDRQTPTTIIDRVYACRRQAMMAGLTPHTIVMCEGDVRRMAGETPPEMLTHKDDVLKRQRDRRKLTLSEFEDQAVEAARAGEMFLYGMQVRLDDSAVELRCEGATRGVKEYRGDQHAGVDNSVQAAQGCRLAAGVSDGADLCTLGTADSTVHMKEQDKARTARRSLYCAIQGRRRHEACYYGGWGLLGHLIGAVLPIALMPPHWPAYGFLMPMATFFGMFAIGHVVAGIGVLLGGGRYG